MQKGSWKYKRLLNQGVYKLRGYPRVMRVLTRCLYALRWLARGGRAPQADLAIEKIYSDSGRYLYVANPKVATRSIIAFFEQNDADNIKVSHQTLMSLYANQQAFDNYFSFSFVRNPWARVYSCWLDKITNQKKFCDLTIISRYRGLYPDMPFEDFVSWLCGNEGGDDSADRHWMSQHRLMTGPQGEILVKFIGKLEHLDVDFPKVAARLDVGSSQIANLNSNQSSPHSYRDYFTDQTRAMIAHRYQKDIELFGYSF